MPDVSPPNSPIAGLRTIELGPRHEALLQRFFEDNPEYFWIVQGEPVGPREAHDEIHEQVPEGWSYTKRWLLGYVDHDGALAAVADMVSDLLVPGVWHIGLFIVETARHGAGDAQALYRSLESWALINGAEWLRLGVVLSNVRAERFWRTQCYVRVKTNDGYRIGNQLNSIGVMVKPLSGGTLDEYLARVERDRPVAAASQVGLGD
jgi:GNAT superfamily N-acetyltransferase